MKPLFSREEMGNVLNSPRKGSGSGIGLYREGYRTHGINFWGTKIGSKVQEFLDRNSNTEWSQSSVLEIGAGTGKNIFELVRMGVNRAVAVEIDSIATSVFVDILVRLEESGLVPEGRVSVVKDDALQFLRHNSERFEVVICYGVLHVLKQQEQLVLLAESVTNAVAKGGHLILQTITDKYPAPASQPELEGVIVTPQLVKELFPKDIWETISWDEEEIVHSHLGSEEDHRHGSVRSILRRLQ